MNHTKNRKRPAWLKTVLCLGVIGWYAFFTVGYCLSLNSKHEGDDRRPIENVIVPVVPSVETSSPGLQTAEEHDPIYGSAEKNIADEYNDRLDDYLADPEDELEFDPGVFDFQDD